VSADISNNHLFQRGDQHPVLLGRDAEGGFRHCMADAVHDANHGHRVSQCRMQHFCRHGLSEHFVDC